MRGMRCVGDSSYWQMLMGMASYGGDKGLQGAVLFCMVLYCTAWCCTVLHGAVPGCYFTVLYLYLYLAVSVSCCIVLSGTLPYSMVLYCTEWCCHWLLFYFTVYCFIAPLWGK